VEVAVEWVRKHAKEYGVDAKRIGTLGGSAGGHLVGMLATDGEGSLKTGHRVAAVVSWSGPMDFVSLAPAAATNAGSSFRTFLGCPPTRAPTRTQPRHPSRTSKSDAPMLIVNSTMELVPQSQADAMKAALDKAGVANQAIILPGRAHSRA
jgi:acetyl esterase/lipase